MNKRFIAFVVFALALPCSALAQDVGQVAGDFRPLPEADATASTSSSEAGAAQGAVEQAVRRFRLGVTGGVAFDPELIQFGAHGAFGPFFRPTVEFRPGIEFGLGEITTVFGINLDVLYSFPGGTADTRWTPYLGAGPNFALSHRDIDLDDDDDGNRFDFDDTDFTGGFNFIAGARNQRRLFFELKATAWGVSNVRLLAGFNF